MLTTEEFQAQIKEWKKSDRWDLIRASSKKRLEAKGYIDLGAGSFVRWIEPEWFEEAKRRGVIAQDKYGQWIPHVDETFEEEVVGRRGGHAITEGKTRIDASRFKAFMKEYKEYEEKKRGQEYYAQKTQEENRSLVTQFRMESI